MKHFTLWAPLIVLLSSCAAPAPAVTPTAPEPSATAAATPTLHLAESAPSEVSVYAFCTLIGIDRQVHVAFGAPIVVIWGWKADSAAHLQDYLDSDRTTVTLDGRDISSTAPYEITDKSPGNYRLQYSARVGALPKGTHKLLYDETWKAMITDGTDTYGPGGKYPAQHDECEILVE